MKYKGLSKDSREIKEDYIYFCFDGVHVSGYDYIENAIENGATLIVGEKPIENLKVAYEQVQNIDEALVAYAKSIYNNPQDKLKLLAVTGTDGKTTTAEIINQLINLSCKCSYIGTNGFYIGNEKEEYDDFTTPFADKLYSYFNTAVSKGSEYLIMEVSSHALKQGRVKSLKYTGAIFTNLGEEHLDFHPNMEDYYNSKKLLFKQIEDNGVAVINTDDKYGERLYQELKEDNVKYNALSIGLNGLDYLIKDIDSNLTGVKFTLVDVKEKKDYEVKSPLLAEFNVYNLAQSLILLKEIGFDINSLINNVDKVGVPGRLEIIKKENNPNIIIDFAHTAEAIQKVMEFINVNKKDNDVIWTLTGSAGERDALKRPEMGNAVSTYADHVILTEDDPRNESVQNIINDLKKGIINEKAQIHEILNRKEAIAYAIDNAGADDTIILFGKGSMELMYYDGYTETYSEKEEVLKNLR